MSTRLQANREEIDAQRRAIEAFNVELQQRVDARTRELRDAQKDLVRAGQLAAVAEVGAGLAHELNNPLAGILGMTQLLRAKAADTGDAAVLARVEQMTVRCREVVDAMLRISAGDVDAAPVPVVDLVGILREAGDLVRGAFGQRGVELELALPVEALPARIEPLHGARILTQVLNSMRAGLSEGAILRVEAKRVDDEVHVLLTPNRPVAQGVARDDWMASGLSLWVARQALDRLGGRLEEPDGANTWVLAIPAG
jgi:C4-dicarboxylate-specific signal transduction histidine kinase